MWRCTKSLKKRFTENDFFTENSKRALLTETYKLLTVTYSFTEARKGIRLKEKGMKK